MDITEPMVVVDSTFAESAPSVDFSAVRRAATGLSRGLPSPPFPELPELSESPEPPEPPQAVTPVSSTAATIERPARRKVVHFIRPTPMDTCHRTLTHSTDSRTKKRRTAKGTSPAPRKVAGLVTD